MSPVATLPLTRIVRTNSQSKLSSVVTLPPSTRMARTTSQSNLSSMIRTPSNIIELRKRSSSNLSRTLPAFSTASLSSTPFDTTKPFYLSHCIVLVSTQPYWTAMQETVSIIYDKINQSEIGLNSDAYKQLIQKYAFLACNTPVPTLSFERLSLSFNLTTDQSVLTFDPPIHANRPVLDLDLSIVLLTLNIGKLLDVLAAILTQQPIIFFSSSYSTLVTTLEGLLYLIYPLKWIHVYVPFVPDGLRDFYLEGPPGSYILGAHSRHQTTVEDLDISVTCNLDDGRNIHVPKNVELSRIPPTKLHRFINQITEFIEEIKVKRSLQNIHRTVRLRINQQREFERQHRMETNRRIIQIFLDLMVDLCGDALKPIYWKVNHQQTSLLNTFTSSQNDNLKNVDHRSTATTTTFSKERYLFSKSEGVELEFYRAFIHTSAFQLFLEEEMASTSPSIFRQTCQLDVLSNENQIYHLNDPLFEDINRNLVKINIHNNLEFLYIFVFQIDGIKNDIS